MSPPPGGHPWPAEDTGVTFEPLTPDEERDRDEKLDQWHGADRTHLNTKAAIATYCYEKGLWGAHGSWQAFCRSAHRPLPTTAHAEDAPMNRRILFSIAAILALVGVTPSESPPETPIGPRWWPSEWGPQDQRGAANRLTPAKVQEATRLIRAGKVYQLGHVYEYGMPLMGQAWAKIP